MGRNVLSVIFRGAGTSTPSKGGPAKFIEGEITLSTVENLIETLN